MTFYIFYNNQFLNDSIDKPNIFTEKSCTNHNISDDDYLAGILEELEKEDLYDKVALNNCNNFNSKYQSSCELLNDKRSINSLNLSHKNNICVQNSGNIIQTNTNNPYPTKPINNLEKNEVSISNCFLNF